MKTESESIEAVMHRRWILFSGFVVRMEDEIAECVMFGEPGKGRGLRGEAGKRVADVSPG